MENHRSPGYQGNVQKILDKARQQAEIYAKSQLGGVLVENMHDIPYVKTDSMGPETVTLMTRACTEVRKILPSETLCGVQVLAGGNMQALAIAQASDFDFIRAEGFVFGHLADEGYMEACAGPLLRYRRNLNCENIRIFADIKKKHSSHAITQDLDVVEVAKAAEFFRSDGVILTGKATGEEADVEELKKVKKCIGKPVLIGSGVTHLNVHKYLSADAIIIGSHFKYNGRWENEIDEERIKSFMNYYSTATNN